MATPLFYLFSLQLIFWITTTAGLKTAQPQPEPVLDSKRGHNDRSKPDKHPYPSLNLKEHEHFLWGFPSAARLKYGSSGVPVDETKQARADTDGDIGFVDIRGRNQLNTTSYTIPTTTATVIITKFMVKTIFFTQTFTSTVTTPTATFYTCKCSADTVCGTSCANLITDSNNCGSCGTVCTTGSCFCGSCNPDSMGACTVEVCGDGVPPFHVGDPGDPGDDNMQGR